MNEIPNITDMKNSKQSIRTLNFKLVSTILFLMVFSYNSNCQSISTISEIYDYEINDIFHTREYGSGSGQSFALFSNIQVLDKYYSSNSDTIFYICDVKTDYSAIDHPQSIFNFYIDTLSYANLDSLINNGNIDTVYYSSYYNGRKVNSYLDSLAWGTPNERYIDGCGGPYYNAYYYPSMHELELIYYKKGLEEWGTPFYVSINEIPYCIDHFDIYPNPSSDKIVIEIMDNNIVFYSGEIYSSFGSLVSNFCFAQNENCQLDISSLNKGLYYIRLNIDDVYYYSKFIKN